MTLDLTALNNALNSLVEAMDKYKKSGYSIFMRDCCIKRFDYTYELSFKMLNRYLKSIAATASEIEQMSFSNTIRTGCDKGLLKSDLEQWKIYREARNTSSHSYNEVLAVEVLEEIPKFISDATFLLEQLNLVIRISN